MRYEFLVGGNVAIDLSFKIGIMTDNGGTTALAMHWYMSYTGGGL